MVVHHHVYDSFIVIITARSVLKGESAIIRNAFLGLN